MLYIDCSAGASGDMLLAGWLGLGLPMGRLRQKLDALGLKGVRVRVRRFRREGVAVMQAVCTASPSLRLPRATGELMDFIRGSQAGQSLQRPLLRVLTTLAHAEGRAHGVPWRRVTLHQIARPAALVNLAGFCVGMEYFRVKQIYVSPIPVGAAHQDHQGVWRSASGPATLHLLKGFSCEQPAGRFEWTTPTAAALLASFACRQAPPPLQVKGMAHAVGHRRPPAGPSVLRIILGEKIVTCA